MEEMRFTIYSERDRQLPFALYGVKTRHEQEHVVRSHGLPFYQWIQCEQGSGTLYLENRQFSVSPGMGFFLLPHVSHSYCSDQPEIPWIVDFVLFDSYVMERLCAGTLLEHSGVYYVNNPEDIIKEMHTLYEEPAVPDQAKNAAHSVTLYKMILMLLHRVSATEGSSSQEKNQYVAPVITYIENHFHEPIYLDQLAAISGLSQTYLCHVFKNVTGLCISDYIKQARIRHSKALLTGSKDIPIRQAGEMCGFTSPSYFNKIFKEIEGISPGEFRKLQVSGFT